MFTLTGCIVSAVILIILEIFGYQITGRYRMTVLDLFAIYPAQICLSWYGVIAGIFFLLIIWFILGCRKMDPGAYEELKEQMNKKSFLDKWWNRKIIEWKREG